MKVVVLVSALAMSPMVVGAQQFVAADNTPATRVCMAAATGSPMDYRMTVKYAGMKERTAARAISCNNESVIGFASRYNQDERTVDRIYRSSPLSVRVTITDLSANTDQSGAVTIQGVVP